MCKATIFLIGVVSILGVTLGNSTRPALAGPQVESAAVAAIDQSATRLEIASVDPLLQATDRYQVGEQAIVTISMVNTSKQQDYACISSDMYQDLPTLKRDGRLVPYARWQTYLLGNLQKDQTCESIDLPERILLKPSEPTVVDFLTIVDDSRNPTGNLAWYDPLGPGNYELTIQRRLGCCAGPMIESNEISFQVVP